MTENELKQLIRYGEGNPLILFRMNLVEHIGSGITRINTLCKEAGIPVPGIDLSDNWVSLSFVRRSGAQSQPESGVQSGVQSGAQSDMKGRVLVILTEKESGKHDIAKKLGKAGRTRYLNDLMKNLLSEGLVEYTIPDKPKSRLQKYRITDKGRDALKA